MDSGLRRDRGTRLKWGGAGSGSGRRQLIIRDWIVRQLRVPAVSRSEQLPTPCRFLLISYLLCLLNLRSLLNTCYLLPVTYYLPLNPLTPEFHMFCLFSQVNLP